MKRQLLLAIGLALLAVPAFGADVIESLDKRFSAADTQEVPDFRKHVAPLMARLGCNGRACHGSFQGRGDLQLSLFGFDFKTDYASLTKGDESKIDLENPAESLAILKATEEEPHEGGQRYEIDSWQHHVFTEWVKGGAKPAGKEFDLERLEITPKEVVFSKKGQKSQFRVIAIWSDGSREDVTPLTRFDTKDAAIASLSDETSGRINSGESGDTHIIVSYDRDVVAIPVIRPSTDLIGSKYPQVATRTPIDAHVITKLKKLGIVPSDVCTDAEFLRRVSIDLTGTLPTPKDVQAFLADSSPDKRADKIDELLESPGYAAWWATKLCDFTGNNTDNLTNVTPARGSEGQHWYDWIHKRVVDNVPYVDVVEGIVMAVGKFEEGQSYEDYCKDMCSLYDKKSPTNYADRDTLAHFWARRNFRRPEERAIGFAYTFMGMRIQCAQCHKHPFDQWSKDDFAQFQKFFDRVTASNRGSDQKAYRKMLADLGVEKGANGGDVRRAVTRALRDGKLVPFPQVVANRSRRGATAKLLGGEVIKLDEFDDARRPLMDWLKSGENSHLSRAFVNRVWANYFNVGIVHPPDDIAVANAPSNAALLEYLTQAFIDNNYDMKWLHREIANSDAYQRSWRPNKTNRGDTHNFSHAIPRRIPAEVALDAVRQATSSDTEIATLHSTHEGRFIATPAAGRRATSSSRENRDAAFALTVFGRSTRESNCDCDRSAETSLLQTVFLQNDRAVYNMIERPQGGWMSQVAEKLGTKPTSSRAVASRPVLTPLQQSERAIRFIKQQLKQEQAKDAPDAARIATGKKRMAQVRRRIEQLKKNPRLNKIPAPKKPTGKLELAAADADDIVRQAYLRTLSRLPSERELTRSKQYITDADNTLVGIEDLLWTLLNTKEFIVNH